MGGGLDLGYTFGRDAELRIGYESGYQKVNEDIGIPVVPAVHGRFGVTSLRYRLERFDDPVLPPPGTRVESTFKFYDPAPGTSDVVPTSDLRLGVASRGTQSAA